MKNSKNIIPVFMISFVFVFNCTNENQNVDLTKQEAEKFISSYVTTLKSGDSKAIKKFWSNKSLNRHGFEVMHFCVGKAIHIKDWKIYLESTSFIYQFKDLVKEDDYYIVNGIWMKPDTEPDSDESLPMPFYLVYENNSWLLSNPIDVLTKNWNRHETDNLVFIYPKEININDHLHEIKSLDEKYQVMSNAMEFTADEKIEYYKASSPQECGRLLTQSPFNGLAAVTYQDSIEWYQIAVSTTFNNAHEVMHIIALSSGVPYSNSFFSEGLAVAYGGTTFQTAEYAHIFSKNILDDNGYIPIKQLLTMKNPDFVRKNYITYQESGSFLRYLIEFYGISKLKDFIFNFDLNEDLDEQTLEVFNFSLDNLEQKWHDFLRSIELPQISFTVPDKAKLVFGMTDPKNDDNGDGDYKYPSRENYVKGCFDLTNFEVYTDGAKVYFKIGVQKLIDPVSYRPGGNKFLPTTVIAINKGGEKNRQIFKYTNEVELIDGYDLKINVGFGINISNSFGKIFVSTKNLYNDIANLKSNTLTFSLPIELIGEPNEEWKYFVGVGIADEPSFNFTGLTPVFKNIPVLISGGNYNQSNPAFIDILLPKNIDQVVILSDYNPEKGKLATIKMVSKTGIKGV